MYSQQGTFFFKKRAALPRLSFGKATISLFIHFLLIGRIWLSPFA
jgi:hypothetical protein